MPEARSPIELDSREAVRVALGKAVIDEARNRSSDEAGRSQHGFVAGFHAFVPQHEDPTTSFGGIECFIAPDRSRPGQRHSSDLEEVPCEGSSAHPASKRGGLLRELALRGGGVPGLAPRDQ